MVVHFPNLVCWKAVHERFEASRDIVYLDSASCFLLGLILGVRGRFLSGPQMAHSLYKQRLKNVFFFLPEDIAAIKSDKKFVLPFRDSFDEDEGILQFLGAIEEGGTVVIGVSSPKQNVFAQYLFSIRPDLTYLCLGAAVMQTWGLTGGNTVVRGTGFQWIEFMFSQPVRTCNKLLRTVREFLLVVTSVSQARRYRAFVLTTKDAPYNLGSFGD